ncbi:MAG: hypothetical protein WEF28_13945 [Acidimicrobiia bacterium]
MTLEIGLVIALAVVVGLLALLVVGLLRSHAEILRKLDSLGAGVEIAGGGHVHEDQLKLSPGPRAAQGATPDLIGVNPDGEPVAVSTSVGTEPLLVAFLSTTCSSCTVFWENLDGSERYFGGIRHRVVIATLGADEESPTRAQSLVRGQADVVMTSQGWADFEVPGAPYFAVIDPARGIVGEGSATTYQALEEFLVDSTNDSKWDRRRAQKDRTGIERESRIDEELRAAGIEPGDPRLYPEPETKKGDGS